MSSILKALKKLEEENATRTPEAIRIDTEILRGGSSSRFPYRNATLLAVLFFVCGSVFTYLYVNLGTHPVATPLPQAAQQLPVAVERSPNTIPPVEDGIAPAPQVDQPHPQAKNAKHVKSLKHSPPPRAPVVAKQPKPGVAATGTTAPATPVKRMPAIRVDGIAYHFGSADSLAVVNGTTVYVGAVVEGAKIEEIGKDRIRFNYEGERFEVPLGKSN